MKTSLPLRDALVIYIGGLAVFVLLMLTKVGPYAHAHTHTHDHDHEEEVATSLAEVHDCAAVAGSTLITVTITDSGFSPDSVQANLCDTLHFVNAGKLPHQTDSGPHPSHGSYPELDLEDPIQPGDSMDVQLTRLGEYSFHDHLNESLVGALEVK